MQVETGNCHSNLALKTESPVSILVLILLLNQSVMSFSFPDFFAGSKPPLLKVMLRCRGEDGDEHEKGALSIPDFFSSKSQSLPISRVTLPVVPQCLAH